MSPAPRARRVGTGRYYDGCQGPGGSPRWPAVTGRRGAHLLEVC